jgi:hypothetical protein
VIMQASKVIPSDPVTVRSTKFAEQSKNEASNRKAWPFSTILTDRSQEILVCCKERTVANWNKLPEDVIAKFSRTD